MNEHGYTHTPERIQAILDIKRPVDSHQLKSLLGMANYMRSHCGSDYATLVQPLNAVSHSFNNKTNRNVGCSCARNHETRTQFFNLGVPPARRLKQSGQDPESS